MPCCPISEQVAGAEGCGTRTRGGKADSSLSVGQRAALRTYLSEIRQERHPAPGARAKPGATRLHISATQDVRVVDPVVSGLQTRTHTRRVGPSAAAAVAPIACAPPLCCLALLWHTAGTCVGRWMYSSRLKASKKRMPGAGSRTKKPMHIARCVRLLCWSLSLLTLLSCSSFCCGTCVCGAWSRFKA